MAVVIPYAKQTWTDGVSSCSAARNNVHEDGINDAHYMPAVRAFHNANQSTVSGTPLTLAFNSERFDTAGNVASTMHDNATNNSRLTCRHAGVYHIGACIRWGGAGAVAGTRDIELRLNATTTIALDRMDRSDIAGEVLIHNVNTVYSLAVNDFVEVRVTQNSGGAVAVEFVANYSPDFWMHRVG